MHPCVPFSTGCANQIPVNSQNHTWRLVLNANTISYFAEWRMKILSSKRSFCYHTPNTKKEQVHQMWYITTEQEERV